MSRDGQMQRSGARSGAADSATASRESGTYLFCLVESQQSPSLPKGLPALPSGGPARALPLDRGVWVVAAEVSLREYSKPAIEKCLQDLDCVSRRAVVHDATITAFFRRWPVIPLKLFTLFASEDRALRHLRPRLRHIRRLFGSLRHHEEWGVRFTIDPDNVARAIRAGADSTGRGYLEAQRNRRRQSSRATEIVRRDVSSAVSSLGKCATRMRRQSQMATDTRRAVLEAAFLVPSRKSRAWKARVRAVGQQLAKRGCRMEVSGPWPPYNFVSVRAS